jgi:membrane protease YdiL (CAAX protease family)
LIAVLVGHLFAALIWFLVFALKVVRFWWGISVASVILACWSIIWAGEDRSSLFAFKLKYILWGVISAAVLYFGFRIGGVVSTHLFPFTLKEINVIYSYRVRMPVWAVSALLVLIGSAEEIFWRGMAQRVFARWFGKNAGWILAAIAYMSVELWSVNFILILTALVAGLYWGWLYKRFGSLWPGIISHALWDLAIFMVLPLRL